MLEISTQTGTREGMIFDVRLRDFDEKQIELRVTEKPNDKRLSDQGLRNDAGPVESAQPGEGVAQEELGRCSEPARQTSCSS
jgi:hypothetical protein